MSFSEAFHPREIFTLDAISTSDLRKMLEIGGFRFHYSDFSRFDLTEQIINAVDFIFCLFRPNHFRKAKITNSAFVDCDLIGRDFTGADLKKVSINNCDVSGMILKPSHYDHVTFYESDAERSQLERIITPGQIVPEPNDTLTPPLFQYQEVKK